MFQNPLIMWDNSKVTLELRDLVENGVKSWDFDYPSFYQEEEKTTFEKKVIDHYYFRQLGQETTGRWLHYFRTRIREIMPYYKQLYESVKIMEGLDDPFANLDVTETFSQITQGENSGETEATRTSSSSGEGTRKYSNTPQGSLDNLDDYLTEGTVESSSGSENGNDTVNTSGTSSGSTEYTLIRKGQQGVSTYAHDIKELRETYINIDMLIINELKDLFLKVY